MDLRHRAEGWLRGMAQASTTQTSTVRTACQKEHLRLGITYTEVHFSPSPGGKFFAKSMMVMAQASTTQASTVRTACQKEHLRLGITYTQVYLSPCDSHRAMPAPPHPTPPPSMAPALPFLFSPSSPPSPRSLPAPLSPPRFLHNSRLPPRFCGPGAPLPRNPHPSARLSRSKESHPFI